MTTNYETLTSEELAATLGPQWKPGRNSTPPRASFDLPDKRVLRVLFMEQGVYVDLIQNIDAVIFDNKPLFITDTLYQYIHRYAGPNLREVVNVRDAIGAMLRSLTRTINDANIVLTNVDTVYRNHTND